MWVADDWVYRRVRSFRPDTVIHYHRVFAYAMASKVQEARALQNRTLGDAGNLSPWGIWSDGATIWVADHSDGKVYAYAVPSTNLPPTYSPTNQRYTRRGSTIVVSWDEVADADYYKVYYDKFFRSSCNVLLGNPTFCEELAGNVNGTSYTHANPDDDTNYYWGTACNDRGCSEIDSSNPATFADYAPKVTAPAAPSTLTATVNGPTRIDLSWRAPSGSGGAAITGYRIEVSSDGSSWSDLVVNTDSTATAYSHAGLTTGSTRHYRVSAINSAGTGPASNVANATTGSAATPDLVVDRPTASESAPDAGERFTLNATVRNQGSGRSAFTTLRYYQSTDPTITSNDTEVGTDYVSRLDASERGDTSVSLPAPSTLGTYYYGACVDAVSDESDTTNNCSSAIAVSVGAAPAPDLVVDAPTVSESTPAAGARFTLNATVRNQGSGRAAFATLRYYQSTDSTITSGDTEVGTDSVSRLDASESGDEWISLRAPSTAGTYYFGGCVDAVSDEADTTNNCSVAIPVTIGATGNPDLLVETPVLSNTNPVVGASFPLSVTVRNQGNGASDSATLRYYRSTDATITGSDTEVGTSQVAVLSISEIKAVSTVLPGVADIGTYYYGACVDAVSDESDTTNNCSDAVSVIVGSDDAASAPGKPTGLTATADGQTEIDLSWNAPSDDGGAGITGYRIEVSTNGSSWSDLEADTDSTSTSYSHTGLTAGSTRHYRVSAINSEGTGPASDTDSVTTDAAAPTDTRACATDGAVANPGVNEDLISDCEILLGLKNPLVGTGSLNWSAATLITSWDGITVGGTPARVTRLELRVRGSTRVTGQLPAALGDLAKLEVLAIYGASTDADEPISLTGSIPVELGKLTNLSELTLHQHKISGTIPARLGNLSKLEKLQLNFTQLGGSIPASLGNLSKLKTLLLYDNDLSGTLPSELGRLGDLQTLSFSLNRLTGSIPAQFGNLSSLLTLALQFNQLSGSIPAELADLTSLQEIYISQNNFTGCIPSGLHEVAKNDLDRVGLTDCNGSTMPGKPTGLTATADGLTEIDLTWIAPSDDGGAVISGYKIEVSTDGSSWSGLEADTDSSTTSYSHTGLTAGSTRHYRVSAINSEGTGPASDSDSATTDAATKPGKPTGLTATADGQTEIDLTWTAPSDDGGADISGYRIEVSTNGTSWSDLVADTDSTSTSYSHTGLTAGNTRHYRVSAINSAGTGTASDSDSATTESASVQETTCSVDLVVNTGESCTYPGRSDVFSVNSSGTASFLFISAGERIQVRNTTVNGVEYTLVASKQSDGTWKIKEVG